MTTLTRRLRRVVPGARNDYVLVLHPETERAAMVEVRLKGRRSGHMITIGGLYVMLAARAADQRKADRRRDSLLRKAGAR